LEVIPLVNSPTEITLKIFLVSQDLGQERQVTPDLTIPDILSRELLTTVTVPNNETIVLGGLITNRTTKSKSGIPVLSQIPYIGGLFGKTSTGTDREELMIFIQPSIVSDRTTLDAAQVDMDSRYDLTPSIRKFADGPGVLPPPDLVPLNEKGTTTTTTKKKAIIVDPAIAPAKAYPHGTRFRSSPR
jgi:type II secretory pathway component GspD/PulD (secretin)